MAPLPWDFQWDRNSAQDMLKERMEWVVMVIAEPARLMDVLGQAEERRVSWVKRLGWSKVQLQWIKLAGSRLLLDWKGWHEMSCLPSLKNSVYQFCIGVKVLHAWRAAVRGQTQALCPERLAAGRAWLWGASLQTKLPVKDVPLALLAGRQAHPVLSVKRPWRSIFTFMGGWLHGASWWLL